MALFIVERVGTGFSVRPGENTLQAAASALISQAWAEGTLPGGAGTKSAKEWATDAEDSAEEVSNNLSLVIVPVFEDLALGNIQNGYIRYNNGVYEPSAAYRSSDFIDISPSDKIIVNVWSQTLAGAAVVYYDSDEVYVGFELRGSGTGTPHPDYELTIPPGAAKMRISGYNIFPPSARRQTGFEEVAFDKATSDSRYIQLAKSVDTTRYGIRWQLSSSLSAAERLGGAVGLASKRAIGNAIPAGLNDFDTIYPWSHMRRCAVSTLPSGAVRVLYEGDAGYATDGTAGDVMVEIPLCFYDRYQEDGFEYRWLSEVGNSPHPAFVEGGKVLDKIYVSAFEGHIPGHEAGGTLHSWSGVLPTTNLFAPQMLASATVKGSGWTLLDLRTVDLLQNLLWIEHATRNSYPVIFHGVSEMIQPRTDTCPIVQAATATNSWVTNLTISANNTERFWPGADVLLCDTLQTNIVARRKVISFTPNVPSAGLSTLVVDGAPLDVTTTMFFGGGPQETGQTDAMAYHTGRMDRAPYDPASSPTIRERLQPNSYRRIENICGNLWHYLPDVTADNLVIYQSRDITDYEFGKNTGTYRPIATASPQGEGNITATDPVWMTGLINDRLFDRAIPVALTSISGNDGGTNTNYFGAGWQLQDELSYIVHGAGFDHKERTNIATLRASVSPTVRWYLYGARLQFKPV